MCGFKGNSAVNPIHDNYKSVTPKRPISTFKPKSSFSTAPFNSKLD